MARLTVKEVLRQGTEVLKSRGIEHARLDAEILLCKVLGRDRAFLHAHHDKALTDDQVRMFNGYIIRRAEREPLQYILEKQEFMSLDFYVNRAVLIPRPETEILVETGLEILKGKKRPLIVDIGTGSGAIAVSLAYYLKTQGFSPQIFATDNSTSALNTARENARRHKVEDVMTFLLGDLFLPLSPSLSGKIDLLLSNPPYIPSFELEKLEPEVRDYEPREALDGGPDGLSFYRRIIPEALTWIRPGGDVLLEVGLGQAETVIRMAEKTGTACKTEAIPDLAGVPRCVRITKG